MKSFLSIFLSITMLLATGCSSTQHSIGAVYEVISNKVLTTDVIVVGAGPSGISAALAAVENGAKSVIIIEKTIASGGAMKEQFDCLSAPNTQIQRKDGILDDSASKYFDDLMILGSTDTIVPNVELLEIYTEKSTKIVDWLYENGLYENYETELSEDGVNSYTNTADEYSKLSLSRTYTPLANDTFYYSSTHEVLDKLLLLNPEIEVFYSTEALSLHANSVGQILTVVAKYGEEKLQFNAKYGVVMATGSHTLNTDLISSFNEFNGSVLTVANSDSNALDIRMMQQVGASITSETMGLIDYQIGFQDYHTEGKGVVGTSNTASAGGIIVNKNGERFINEVNSNKTDKVSALIEQPLGVQYEIYTDEIITDLIAYGDASFMQKYFLTDEYKNQITAATSIEELAIKLDLPMDTFTATVADYNVSNSIGVPDNFGRDPLDIDGVNVVASHKIESENYYAIKTELVSVGTLGGVKVNSDMQVLDNNGVSIPGLYASGDVVGGIFGTHKSQGVALTSAVTFGKLAGENAMTLAMTDTYIVNTSVDLFDDSFFFEVTQGETVDHFSLDGAKDGEYEVTVSGENGPMKVVVVISEERLAFVQVLSHNEEINIAEIAITAIPEAIVRANTISVDVVAGATLTSERIINAVEIATVDARR